MGYSPSIQIVRGQAYRKNPCAALHRLAVQNYGHSSALPVSLLQTWYERNRAIFRIAVVSESLVVGYLSALPLFANVFEKTLEPDFQEKCIDAADILPSFCPAEGGIFISSILVTPEYRRRSPASLLLRLAFIEDLIGECIRANQLIRISAQVLSPGGGACMRSLGLKAGNPTPAGWRIYDSRLGRADLLAARKKLQHKLAARF